MNKSIMLLNNVPVGVPHGQIRRELMDALRFGTWNEVAINFRKVCMKYGATLEQVDYLMQVPVCDMVAAIEGRPVPGSSASSRKVLINNKSAEIDYE